MRNSVVGIRATWVCATCKRIEVTRQIVQVLASAPLVLPPGWQVEDGATLCGVHVAPQDLLDGLDDTRCWGGGE